MEHPRISRGTCEPEPQTLIIFNIHGRLDLEPRQFPGDLGFAPSPVQRSRAKPEGASGRLGFRVGLAGLYLGETRRERTHGRPLV